MSRPSSSGSTDEFDKNWRNRPETGYNHWTSGRPVNQIQLAFRCHWELFSEMVSGTTCLEVGAGRGSLSSYFAQHGFGCTLLDYSEAALRFAKSAFAQQGHRATFVVGDANRMPFDSASFDVVTSIGLLEHFEDVRPPLSEQVRVLRPGGRLIAYIVPERPDNVQRHWRWLNDLLKRLAVLAPQKAPHKVEVYRSDFDSKYYIAELAGLPVANIEAFGVYPLPMVSHSPEFPFSLLPVPFERLLTRVFEQVLRYRRWRYRRNPWICDEAFGQAFVLTATKRIDAL